MNQQKIESLKKILEKDPNSLLAHFGLAKEYFDSQNYEASFPHFQECLRVKPNYSAAYRFLGIALDKAGKKDEAKEVFKKGVAVAGEVRDLEAAKVMAVYLKRLEKE